MSASTAIKQVTKSTFTPSLLHELKSQIDACDFISLASLKTASFSAASPWRRRLFPFDTAETAYLKAKLAAESFEMLNFSVCPFRIDGHKVVAFPYNFHLFPKDVLNMNMPSYSFSCQPSYLASLAREGFDFNLCIYEGISYLSRVQESLARERNPTPEIHRRNSKLNSNSNTNVADLVFMERIKSRVEHWRKTFKKSNRSPHGDQELVSSLRRLILGTETYGTRPCMNIDVCTDRQVELVLETINNISDDLVPLVVPHKSGASWSVRIVLTSSNEDKNLLLLEIQHAEEEQNLKIHGFREVIDLVSRSHKPIVAYNCLYDFTFVHSKFIGPLPKSVHEFTCSLKMVFPNIVDLGHLMKEIGPLRKAKNVASALSCLNEQVFVPIHLEVPFQAKNDAEKNNQGRNVLKITSLFAKLSKFLKCSLIEEHSNIFHPISCANLDALSDQENIEKLDPDNLIFILGFNSFPVSDLRARLKRYHSIFNEDFDLKILDRNCAVLVFWRQGAAIELFKEMMENSSSRAIMLSDGVKFVNFEAYKKVCKLGFWDEDLANSLENAMLSETDSCIATN